MSDDGTREQISSSADADFGLYELAAVYTPGGAEGPFGVFAGARFVDVSLDVTLSAPIGSARRSADRSLTDFMVGARYVFIRRSLGAEPERRLWRWRQRGRLERECTARLAIWR
jgi:hypothetical protein